MNFKICYDDEIPEHIYDSLSHLKRGFAIDPITHKAVIKGKVSKCCLNAANAIQNNPHNCITGSIRLNMAIRLDKKRETSVKWAFSLNA